MARNLAFICFVFIAVVSCRSTSYNLARRVEQSLVDRSTYSGGWPLAAVPCPSDASVACNTGDANQINQQCCPTGNTCFSWPSTFPVCCPSSDNCVGQLQNLPVCANSSWNMYDLGDDTYFCCEQGQIGVIPTAGYSGICQVQGQAVPSSLLATLVNQDGDATATASNPVSIRTTTSGTDTTPTSASTSTGLSSTSGSSAPSTSNDQKSSGGTHLATGAIAGIAVGGAIVIAVVILVLWKCCTRKVGSTAQQTIPYETAVERPFQPASPPMHEYKVSPVVATQQVYQQPLRISEISGENRQVGRAEM